MDRLVTALSNTDSEDPFLAAVEGYYTGALLDGLHRAGLLQRLSEPRTVAELATNACVSPRILAPILAYLARPGGALHYEAADETYSTHQSYFDGPMPAHLLDQYIGAYGGCLDAVPDILA